MSRISDKDNFLINAEYVFNKLKIRVVFYVTIIVLVLILISIFSFRFSVNITFEGVISEASTNITNDSNYGYENKLIEIQLNQTLSDVLKKRQDIQIELSNGNIPIYRCKGEIIRYLKPLNEGNENAPKAIISKSFVDGQIQFFPSNLPENYKAAINISNVKVRLNDLLNLIVLKNLCSIEI